MNTSIDLSEMRAFVAVVTDGSFTTAAERLGTDKARVSRIVRRMEEKLSARLLTRSTRRLSVTEVGRDYFERAVCILSAAEAAEAAVAQQAREPKGLLKVTAGSEFGTMVVDGWIADFLRLAPLPRQMWLGPWPLRGPAAVPGQRASPCAGAAPGGRRSLPAGLLAQDEGLGCVGRGALSP